MIGFELEVLSKKFDRFGWDRDRDTPAQGRLIADWMAALQDYPLDEVRAACRAAVLDNPHKMPNEGHIVSKIMAARAQRVAVFKSRRVPAAEEVREEINADVLAKRAAFAESVLRKFKSED